VAELQPSARGELEISDLNRKYLEQGELYVRQFSRGFAWLDTGTPESLLQASQFVAAVEQRQGLKIACLEEIAIKQGFVSCEEVAAAMSGFNSPYAVYVNEIIAELKQSRG
jgi:glucose-1-phosphate thymidylyltransferase